MKGIKCFTFPSRLILNYFLIFIVLCSCATIEKNDEKKVRVAAVEREKILDEICEKGNIDACFALGFMPFYVIESDINNDSNRAVFYLDKACVGEIAQGCMILGYVYLNSGKTGDGAYKVAGTPALSRKEYIKECESGSESSCADLGLDYEYGYEGSKNRKKATEFYEKACNMGSDDGCIRLGFSYLKNEITNESIKNAKKLWAWEKNCERFGGPYSLGGIDRDIEKARIYFRKACNLGYEKACEISNVL